MIDYRKREIKYQLWIEGYLDELERNVLFLFCMPETYETYEAADKENSKFHVIPRELESKEIVFDVYRKFTEPERQELVDTIHWKDFRKYECQIVSEKGISHTLAEIEPKLIEELGDLAQLPCMTDEDLEPYADRFEVMFQKYLNTEKYSLEKICSRAVQCTCYEVRPVIIEIND